MREGHQVQVLLLRGAILHVGEVSNGDVPNVVLSPAAGAIAAEVADRGQALGVGLPGFARSQQFPYHVVRGDGECGGGIAVVVGEDLAGGEHQVVTNGRVGIRVILRGQSVLTHQA